MHPTPAIAQNDRDILPDARGGTAPDDLADELSRQAAALRGELAVRALATAIGYAAALVYLPLWAVLPVALVNLAGEVLTARMFRDIARLAASRARQRILIVTVFVIEVAFVLPPSLLWHLDDPYTKALAVGLASATMMHLATVRAIHLPHGYSGAVALALSVLVSNTLYWVWSENWGGLAVSTLCGTVAIGYFVAAMQSNHRLHAETALGQRVARAANVAKGRFLATMSHELRTPLNGILGLAHAELRRAQGAEAQVRLAALVDSAEGLRVILDDMLDLNAVQDGRLPIRRSRGIPAEDVAAALALFAARADEAGATLSLVAAPDLAAPALYDRQRLRQCLSNLLSNAIRHGGAGAVTVGARYAIAADGIAVLSVSVRDAGPGVPASLRDRLFEPFAGRPADARGADGHGLGLAIARSLARQMGGDLVFRAPETGPGAEFHLTIALAPLPTGRAPQAASAVLPMAGRRVLVVDDIATNRLVAVTCLGVLGATTAEAANGPEALRQLAGHPFDAVLLDINMPELDGHGTLARIRTLPGPAARVPVIAMTAESTGNNRAVLLDAGLNGFVGKPVTPDTIAAELVAVLAACGPGGVVSGTQGGETGGNAEPAPGTLGT